MFKSLDNWLENRRIKAMDFTVEQWESAIADWAVMERYQGSERDNLREMSFHFLARKGITPGGEFEFTDAMCLKLATMACVPVLHLGLDWYDHCQTIICTKGILLPITLIKVKMASSMPKVVV